MVSMLIPLLLPSPLSLRQAFSVHSLAYNSSKTASECPHDLDFLISYSSMVDLKCCVNTAIQQSDLVIHLYTLTTFTLSSLTTLCISIPDHLKSQSNCFPQGQVPSLVQSAVEQDDIKENNAQQMGRDSYLEKKEARKK